MNLKNADYDEILHKIAVTKLLLADQFISGPLKRDRTKYLEKLEREKRRRDSCR